MNNIIFGKSVENVRGRSKVKLINSEKKIRKAISKPTYKRSIPIREDLAIVEEAYSNLVLNKPIATGFTVLEIAKVSMYNFWYDYMLEKYGIENISLLYTDTDSFIIEIRYPDHTGDAYKDMIDNSDYFDFSNWRLDSPQLNGINDEEKLNLINKIEKKLV